MDGVDTKEMTRHELRDRFGMVLQDAWLFEGSIRDNIASVSYTHLDVYKRQLLWILLPAYHSFHVFHSAAD